jgi:hypothetical protein
MSLYMIFCLGRLNMSAIHDVVVLSRKSIVTPLILVWLVGRKFGF